MHMEFKAALKQSQSNSHTLTFTFKSINEMQFTRKKKNHTHPFENLSKPAHDENNLGDAAFQPYKNLQKFLNEQKPGSQNFSHFLLIFDRWVKKTTKTQTAIVRTFYSWVTSLRHQHLNEG